jgi:hypothetical protein
MPDRIDRQGLAGRENLGDGYPGLGDYSEPVVFELSEPDPPPAPVPPLSPQPTKGRTAARARTHTINALRTDMKTSCKGLEQRGLRF